MSRDRVNIDWRAPGPVARAFYDDMAPISAIMGPVGSGKTTAALVKIVEHARKQRPSPRDGVRRYKHLVIRDTFVNIQRTILPSWFGIFPKSMGEWVGGPPAVHKLKFDDGQGSIELQVDFMGLGDDVIENLLRGYEMTGFYANEVDLMSYGTIDFLFSRAGRYPSAMDGGCVWRGGWMDFNAPEQDHWLHQLLVDKIIPESDPPQAAEGFSFYVQPGGMDAGAENRAHLPADYYEKMMGNMPQWRARRLVHNRWGYSRDGKPVYPEFNDNVHVAPAPLEPLPGVPVVLGIDAGGTPAAAFGQFVPGGGLRVFAEIVTGPGTGPKGFGRLILDVVAARCRGFEISGWVDPAAEHGVADGADRDWIAVVRQVTGIPLRPAPTNAPGMRQEALRSPLSRLVEGRPGFLLSPCCKALRKALNSGYHYRRIQSGGASGRFDTKPNKNEWSHVAEALEYLALGGPGGLAAVIGREAGRQIVMENDYDVYEGVS